MSTYSGRNNNNAQQKKHCFSHTVFHHTFHALYAPPPGIETGNYIFPPYPDRAHAQLPIEQNITLMLEKGIDSREKF